MNKKKKKIVKIKVKVAALACHICFKPKNVFSCFKFVRPILYNVPTTNVLWLFARFTEKIVLLEYLVLVQSFFQSGACFFQSRGFVCSASCSELETERTVGNKLILFGLKVVTKAEELVSVLAFGDRNSAIRILTALFVLSYIKFCDYSCETKSFSSSFSHICIMLLFSTTV